LEKFIWNFHIQKLRKLTAAAQGAKIVL